MGWATAGEDQDSEDSCQNKHHICFPAQMDYPYQLVSRFLGFSDGRVMDLVLSFRSVSSLSSSILSSPEERTEDGD